MKRRLFERTVSYATIGFEQRRSRHKNSDKETLVEATKLSLQHTASSVLGAKKRTPIAEYIHIHLSLCFIKKYMYLISFCMAYCSTGLFFMNM